MAELKGVIFGIRDVLVQQGTMEFDKGTLAQIGRLVKFLESKGIKSVALANRDWHAKDNDTGKTQSLQECLRDNWGVEFEWFVYGRNGCPPKQSADSLAHVRKHMGWEVNEMIYVGNSDEDMQCAVNGKTLFLNALWYGDNTEYGLRFASPKQVARFIDIFCLRKHWWYFRIEDGDLRVYALAPYSTLTKEVYKGYSEDFIVTVKRKLGDEEDVDFWANYLCTSMYFSGVYRSVNYIAPYPGHERGSTGPTIVAETMTAFAKCFRTNFIRNLFIRHKTSVESKKHRDEVDHANQLNTIHLNKTPKRSETLDYAKCPLNTDKTVLVVDDILTEGYSFEAARTYAKAAKAQVICVGFLKAMKRDYKAVDSGRLVFSGNPFTAQLFKDVRIKKVYAYRDYVCDPDAASELSVQLDRYPGWKWPKE